MMEPLIKCKWCREQYPVFFKQERPMHILAKGTPQEHAIICEDFIFQADEDFHTEHANGE